MAKDKPKRLTLDMIPERQRERFWDRVSGAFEEGDRCWIWVGARVQQTGGRPPRGVVYIGPRSAGAKRKHYAYRVAYLLVNGRLPAKLMRHLCHNELCCNPAHLRASTKSRNVKDSWAVRGTQRHTKEDCCDVNDGTHCHLPE